MKILMLGWELPPHNSGGLGVACYQLCKALNKSGADIEFILPYTSKQKVDFMKITPASSASAVEMQNAGIAYDSFLYLDKNGNKQWLNIFDQQKVYEKSVEKILELGSYDIIHAHDWLTFRAGVLAKEKTGIPLVLHVHSIESDRAGGNYGNPFVREIEYSAMLIADTVLAVSEHTKKAIVREYGIPSEKIKVLHNSFDSDDIIPIDGENAYFYCEAMKAAGYSVVTNAGRITIQKGLPNLLRAAQLVIQVQPKTLFLIVGGGEQEYELLEQAAELGIGGNVVFAGFQRGKRWRDAFSVGDLFVMPSISEPFGLTPLEAVAYGTPSLISKQSGVAEVLLNCLKVDFWDIDEMANQIVGALRSHEMRAELLKNATVEYEKMSWSNSADKLMEVYHRHVGVAI